MGRGATGPSADRVFAVEDVAILSAKLMVRPDPLGPSLHAFVEPAVPMALDAYESALTDTRPSWRPVWP